MGEVTESGGDYKVYTSRWLMLFVVCFLNFSNALMWLTFAPVADTFIAYYSISSSQLNMLTMTFLFATIPLGFVATWLLDTFGLRASLLLSAWLNAVGGLLRITSIYDIVPKDHAYTVLLTGQILAACAQPFVMFAPTKLAAVWFPPSHRATANMCGTMMKPVGNMAAFIVIPLIVDGTGDIPVVLWLTSGLSFIITIVITLGVRRATPPTPPSPSAENKSTPRFFAGLKKVLVNKNYIVLNLVFGGGQALYTALIAFMEQILCPRGYTDEFSGMCASLLLGVGLLMAVPVSLYVDKTKKFDEVFKVMYGLAALSGIAFIQVARMRDKHVLVALTAALTGAFGVSIYPIGFELSVEVTYPVASATGSGLCLVGGQIQGIMYMFVMQYLTRRLPSEERNLPTGCYIPDTTDTDQVFEPRDWTYANLFIFNAVSVATFVVLVLFFKPKYRRILAERKAMEAKRKPPEIPTISSTRL